MVASAKPYDQPFSSYGQIVCKNVFQVSKNGNRKFLPMDSDMVISKTTLNAVSSKPNKFDKMGGKSALPS